MSSGVDEGREHVPAGEGSIEDWRGTGGSRLSKTDRADPTDGSYEPSARRSRKRPLTDRDGVSLRNEVRDWDDLDGDRPISWNGAINRWREYIRDKRDVESVFENSDGKRVQGSKPHRFAPEYSDKQYAKLKDLERGLADEYGKRFHTAMLSFTASGAPNGEPLPPVDHLDGLLESWEAIRRSLDRVLDGRRWERLAILEPHPGDGENNGYLHIHIAVFVDGPITAEQFQPVIEAHLRNCDIADRDAHGVDDIQVRHAGADRDGKRNHALAEGIEFDSEVMSELAVYLAEYLGTYGDGDPLDAPEHVQAANAVLWATQRQRWRPSNGAQQYMKTEPKEPDSDWSLVGIEKDGEFVPADPENGGVDTFTTCTDPPD
jgi:hypothetical protein